MEIVLQPYQEPNYSDFRRLFGAYFAEVVQPLPEERLVHVLEAILADLAQFRMSLSLLFVDGEAAGFSLAQIDTTDNPWCIRPGWGFVREFYVAPEWRLHGLGRRLWLHTAAFFRRQHAPAAYLTAEPDKGGPFWERMGFAATDEICARNELPIYVCVDPAAGKGASRGGGGL